MLLSSRIKNYDGQGAIDEIITKIQNGITTSQFNCRDPLECMH